MDCEGLPLGNSHEQVELVGKSQGPHQQRTPHGWGLLQVSDQGEPLGRAATGSLVLTNSHPDGGFQPSRNLLGKQYRAGCKQFRRFLECIKGKFQIQVLDKPMREEALVDLLLTNTNEPIQGLRLEAAWAVVVTMPWLSLRSQETWAWQRAKSGP